MINIELNEAITIITGGAGGIGSALAEQYFKAGSKVIILDIIPEYLFREKIDIPEMKYVEIDLLDTKRLYKVLRNIYSEFGQITHLINNVGMYGNDGIEEIDIQSFKKMIDINIIASLNMLHVIIPIMKERRYGRVVNISSIAAYFNGVNSGTYNMTKAAVISMTKTLAKEVRDYGINVNAVCPGLVDTPMLDEMITKRAEFCGISNDDYRSNLMKVCEQTRLVRPREVADVALYLGSKLADGVSGASIPVTANGLLI